MKVTGKYYLTKRLDIFGRKRWMTYTGSTKYLTQPKTPEAHMKLSLKSATQ